jgi:hypothetical protein
MGKMKRELVINVTVLSFILSALYGFFVTNTNNTIVSTSDSISDQGGFRCVWVTLFMDVFVSSHH